MTKKPKAPDATVVRKDQTWRAPRTITCIVEGCGASATVVGQVVPPGWREVEDGLVCPREKLTVVVERVSIDEAEMEARTQLERGAIG